MRMLGGNCVLRSAVKNSEKKSEKPRTSVSRVPTRIMLCFAPGMLPASCSNVSPVSYHALARKDYQRGNTGSLERHGIVAKLCGRFLITIAM